MAQVKASDDIHSWYDRLIALHTKYNMASPPTKPSLQNQKAQAQHIKDFNTASNTFGSNILITYATAFSFGFPVFPSKGDWSPNAGDLIVNNLKTDIETTLTNWENWCPDVNVCSAFSPPCACPQCGGFTPPCPYSSSNTNNCPQYTCAYGGTTDTSYCPAYSCSSHCLQVANNDYGGSYTDFGSVGNQMHFISQ